ncbi:hypothetical protein G4B88_019092 [Cannabis sativa]|uniref:Uncharacterized protein n=1 Tax=Cannabis sativa TaxID=3483 RepID=A0A7J6H2Z3_CANSA|nr:hypothetical protein G4B88_019092 [Cannabis sativa]
MNPTNFYDRPSGFVDIASKHVIRVEWCSISCTAREMALSSKTRNMLENLVREGSFKWLLGSRSSFNEEFEEMGRSPSARKNWISELSPIANIVVRRCSKILSVPTTELQESFNAEASHSVKHPSRYARNFLEYCCFKALALSTQVSGHLADKKFRRLTYDMMVAWEAPAADSKPSVDKLDEDISVGIEAFSRIAPAVPVIANVIISENLFEVLTTSTCGRLQFSIYDKYLSGLERLRKLPGPGRLLGLVTSRLRSSAFKQAVTKSFAGLSISRLITVFLLHPYVIPQKVTVRVAEAFRSQAALTSDENLEVQPIQQLHLAPGKVSSGMPAPKVPQGGTEATVWSDENGEGFVFLEKSTLLQSKRQAEIADGGCRRGLEPIVDCAALSEFLALKVGGDVVPFASEIIDQTSNNICELTTEKWDTCRIKITPDRQSAQRSCRTKWGCSEEIAPRYLPGDLMDLIFFESRKAEKIFGSWTVALSSCKVVEDKCIVLGVMNLVLVNLNYLSYRAIRKMRTQSDSSLLSVIRSSKGEKILEMEGAVTTQPVLEHVGISTWPGRLTLTDHALYFEALRVVSYDKAKRYDLSDDLKQIVKPELTGPWGTRLFDKAVFYKSISLSEPVVIEFPELKGHTRRDYWLAIIREILYVHRFINKFEIKGVKQDEAVSKAVLGILRLQAIQEISSALPLRYESLLMFNLCDQLPGGDLILETLANMSSLKEIDCYKSQSGSGMYSISALDMVSNLGFVFNTNSNNPNEDGLVVGEITVGEMTSLERAVKESKNDYEKVVVAQQTIDGVKVEGIDTNLAVMKELLFPMMELGKCLHSLVYWEDPLRSLGFCSLLTYIIFRQWLGYTVALMLIFTAIFMVLTRIFSQENPVDEVKVLAPPPMNTVEQLLAVQNAISQAEEFIQDGNVVLLKLRALLLVIFPQASEKFAIALVLVALVFALLPSKYVILFLFLEAFTRYSPPRKASTERWMRRLREWWFSIPAAPVLLEIEKEDRKRK